MKIGGAPLAEDLKRIEAVLDVVGGDGQRLAVDVNGRFDLSEALEYAKAIEPYNLFWYEEIGDPLDYALNATVSEHYKGRIATGENLFSLQDARNLIRYGGMRPDRDIIQVDPALSYGLTEYLRIQDMLRQHGWSSRRCIPHGGHQFSLHIAAALKLGGNESYPGEFQPTGGFADNAVVAGQPGRADRHPRHRLRRQGRVLQGPQGPARLITGHQHSEPNLSGRIFRPFQRAPARPVPAGTGATRPHTPVDRTHPSPAQHRQRSPQRCVRSGATCPKKFVAKKKSRSPFRHLKELWVQVVIGAVLGIAIGLLFPRSVLRSNRSTTGSSPWSR